MVNNKKVTPLEKISLLSLLFFFTANSLIVCSRFPVPLHKDRSCSFLIQWHFSKTGPIIVNRRDIEKMHLCAVFSLKFYDHNRFVSEIKHFLCIIFVVQLLGYSGSFRNRVQRKVQQIEMRYHKENVCKISISHFPIPKNSYFWSASALLRGLLTLK